MFRSVVNVPSLSEFNTAANVRACCGACRPDYIYMTIAITFVRAPAAEHGTVADILSQ